MRIFVNFLKVTCYAEFHYTVVVDSE